MKDYGSIFVGKTNMPEFCFGTTTSNFMNGDVASAIDPLRTAGGSSGGSAAAVASGIGYRPTIGRWSFDFGMKLTHSRDSLGPIANSVSDIIYLDEIITGERALTSDMSPHSITIGVPEDYFLANLDP